MSETGERTEQATERQVEKYRREGRVAMSRELLAAVSLGTGALGLLWQMPAIGHGVLQVARDSFTRGAVRELVAADIGTLAVRAMEALGPPVVLALLPGTLAAIGVGLVLTGFNVSTEAIEPNPSRLDVFAAAKSQFFSFTPWINLLKAAAVATLVAWAVVSAVRTHLDALPAAASWPVGAQLTFLGAVARSVLERAVPVALFIGAADFGWQKWHMGEQMRMTRQDVRQEHKESEGDPQIRARRRQRARQLAMGRQLKDVARADVIVANPTHFAVALRYRKDENAAPVVVARGVDHLALKIRAEAARHDIAVIENRPLARALYARSKVGSAIPSEFYGPVAQVLALVYRRRRRK